MKIIFDVIFEFLIHNLRLILMVKMIKKYSFMNLAEIFKK